VAWSAMARWRLRPACPRSAARPSQSNVGANRADKAIMIAILEIGLAELLDAACLDADGAEIDHFLIVQVFHRIFLSKYDSIESHPKSYSADDSRSTL
jgi:hypothetical protein